MAGRTLGGATVAMIQGRIVVLICFAAGFRVTNLAALPYALVFMLLVAVMFTALGTAILRTVGLPGFSVGHELPGVPLTARGPGIARYTKGSGRCATSELSSLTTAARK